MAGHDICLGVGLARGSGINGMSHIISMTHMQQRDLEILCKISHACTHVDTQASSFYGHVTLGLKIHFFFLLSQPSVSKICSFSNSCIHLSPFWVFRKIFTAFTLQVYTHFSTKPFVLIGESFSKKSWKLFLSNSVLAFS